MKNTVIWVLRYLAIPVAFIWSLGIFNLSFSTGDKRNDFDFDNADYQTLEINPVNVIRYSDSIIKNRKEIIAQGKIYEPYLYFHDLKQFKMFEIIYFDSLNSTYAGRGILLRFAGGLGVMSELTNLRDENWRNLDFKSIQKSGKVFSSMNIDEARSFWFANQEKRLLASQKETDKFFWSNIWNWLVSSYFKGMLVAFFLFLIWIKRFKKDCENVYDRYEQLKQPENSFSLLSFIYALLVWPIILIRDIRNRGKETLRKAEVLARRKDMFSLLSNEEKQLLKLGRKMNLREFRKKLDEKGLVRKRSVLTALCILPILILYSHTAIAKSTQQHSSKTTMSTKICFDNDVGKEKISTYSIDICLPKDFTIIRILVEKKIVFFKNVFKILKGFLKKPKGVPKCYLFTLQKV